eukprot:364575-Chlamydomonas_euryale.AAC.5
MAPQAAALPSPPCLPFVATARCLTVAAALPFAAAADAGPTESLNCPCCLASLPPLPPTIGPPPRCLALAATSTLLPRRCPHTCSSPTSEHPCLAAASTPLPSRRLHTLASQPPPYPCLAATSTALLRAGAGDGRRAGQQDDRRVCFAYAVSAPMLLHRRRRR